MFRAWTWSTPILLLLLLPPCVSSLLDSFLYVYFICVYEFTRQRDAVHELAKKIAAVHLQPEVNYLPRFSPQLISLEEYTLRVYFPGEIDLLEKLDIVHITLLVGVAGIPDRLVRSRGHLRATGNPPSQYGT